MKGAAPKVKAVKAYIERTVQRVHAVAEHPVALGGMVIALKVFSGLVVAIAILTLLIWLPKMSFLRPPGLTAAEQAGAEGILRGHLLQMLGGILLTIGAYFTGRTFALNREGQITERFTRAVGQLADEKNV